MIYGKTVSELSEENKIESLFGSDYWCYHGSEFDCDSVEQ